MSFFFKYTSLLLCFRRGYPKAVFSIGRDILMTTAKGALDDHWTAQPLDRQLRWTEREGCAARHLHAKLLLTADLFPWIKIYKWFWLINSFRVWPADPYEKKPFCSLVYSGRRLFLCRRLAGLAGQCSNTVNRRQPSARLRSCLHIYSGQNA